MYRHAAVMLFVVLLAATPVKAQVDPTPPTDEIVTESQASQASDITTVIVDGKEYSLEEFEEFLGDQPLDWVEDAQAEAQGKLVASTREENAEAAPRSVNRRCDPYANGFLLCPTIYTSPRPRSARAVATVSFEPNATRATACNLTTWVILIKGSQRWTFGRTTRSCTYVMQHPGTVAILGTASTGTTATYAIARACIDLYYNGSSHSGWQFCQESEKVGFN